MPAQVILKLKCDAHDCTNTVEMTYDKDAQIWHHKLPERWQVCDSTTSANKLYALYACCPYHLAQAILDECGVSYNARPLRCKG